MEDRTIGKLTDSFVMRNRIRENSYSPTVSKPLLVDTPKWKLTQNTYDLYVKLVERVANELGHEIFMTDWYRSPEEQNALYQQGRSKPWQIVTYLDWINNLSDHNLGIAFDIAFRWDKLYPSDKKIWNDVADIAMELWLMSWGKEWDWDRPHFRLELDRWVPTEEVKETLEDVELVAKEVWEEYSISSDFIICVATAETSLGKSLKSKNNYLNTWNHDSWATKWFDSIKHNFQYWMDALVNWPYLSKRTNVAELSCWWRINALWWDHCKPTKEDYYRASSDFNRHNNVTTCLSKRLWWEKEDYDNYNYKL